MSFYVDGEGEIYKFKGKTYKTVRSSDCSLCSLWIDGECSVSAVVSAELPKCWNVNLRVSYCFVEVTDANRHGQE